MFTSERGYLPAPRLPKCSPKPQECSCHLKTLLETDDTLLVSPAPAAEAAVRA